MKIKFSNNSIINSAEYGKNETYINVIDIINKLILEKIGLIVVSNNTFYNDPLYLIVKELRIIVDNILYIVNENDVLIVEYDTNNTIKDIVYDLERSGILISGVADDILTTPILIADPISNRDGWYYNNNNNLNSEGLPDENFSIINWYNNNKDISMNKLNSFYCIITMDTISPIHIYLTIRTHILDDGEDAFPDYRTEIIYKIPDTSLLYVGERIMLYKYERPMIHSELRAIELDVDIINGPNGPNEVIQNIYLNTSITSDSIQYMIHYAGFIDSDINHIIQYKFENSIERIGKSNLALSNKYGSSGNIYSGNLAPGIQSNPFNCSRYTNNCVITYEDANITHVGNILIFACGDDSVFVCIGILQPITSINKRYGSSNIRLGAFNYIYMLNNSISETHTDIICSLYSS